MHARPLTPEGETRADRQQSADEFDGHQNERRGRELAIDDRLDVRNPAANRIPLKRRTSQALKAAATAAPVIISSKPRSGWPCQRTGKENAKRSAVSRASPENPDDKLPPQPRQYRQSRPAGTSLDQPKSSTPVEYRTLSTQIAPSPWLWNPARPRQIHKNRCRCCNEGRFNHDISRAADHDEMFHIITANDNKLAPPVERKGFAYAEAARIGGSRNANTAPEHITKGQARINTPARKMLPPRHMRALHFGKTHHSRLASGWLT